MSMPSGAAIGCVVRTANVRRVMTASTTAAADPPAGAGEGALDAAPTGFATTRDKATPSSAPAPDIWTPQKPKLRVYARA